MLILSRRIGETIVINGNIKITFVSNDRGQLKIGIDAPKDVIVDREEIHNKRNEVGNGTKN